MGALTDFIDTATNTLGFDLPDTADGIIAAIVGAIVVFTIVLTIGGLFTWAFRKIFARMGHRPGPNRVGPAGLFQFLADGAKLISKEDVRPARADRFAWTAAVYVSVVFTVLAWAPLPWSEEAIFSNAGAGVLLILAMGAIAPLAEMLAGWGSNNKYSLYGGVRAAALDVSYEIPMLFCVASVVLITGSLDTNDIVRAQSGMWFFLPQIIGFVLFFMTALAKAGLAPTDLAESESELVSGFVTEYSGMRFGFLFVVLFSQAFFIGAMMTMLYLGGWQAPFAETVPVLQNFIGPFTAPFWFLAKSLVVSFVVFWVWVSLPRVRVDQYLATAWKVMLPLSIVNFILTAVLVKMEVLG